MLSMKENFQRLTEERGTAILHVSGLLEPSAQLTLQADRNRVSSSALFIHYYFRFVYLHTQTTLNSLIILLGCVIIGLSMKWKRNFSLNA